MERKSTGESTTEFDFARSAAKVTLSGSKWFVLGMLVVLIGHMLTKLSELHDERVVTIMIFDSVLALLLIPLLWAIVRDKVPYGWASAVLTAVSLTGTANILMTAWMEQNVGDLHFVPYIAVAAGAFLISTRWLMVFLVLMSAPTAYVASQTAQGAPLEAFMWSLLIGVVAAIALHATRLGTHKMIAKLRRKDITQARELSAALKNMEREFQDHKSTEKDRRALETQLHQSQKMESLGLLAGGVAHDMNNVLAAIILLTSNLKEIEDINDPDLAEIIEDILNASRRGKEFTQNLLGFARRGEYRREDVDLANVIADLVQILKRTAPKDLEIETFTDDNLDVVCGDPALLAQVLLNLSLNSVDAGCTRLSIRARNLRERDSGRREICLQVVDNGHGMSAEAIEHVFEPFYTTKQRGEGTGLGLSMVYGTVANHGGTVSVESEPAVETTVTVSLPSQEGRVNKAPIEKPRTTSQRTYHSKSVLIVDDEELVRRSMARILGQLGFEVEQAINGVEALELYQAGGRFDLVFLDMLMPVMGGHETFDRLRAIDPAVEVVLITGYADGDETKSLIASGARLLSKPFEREQLEMLVGDILT